MIDFVMPETRYALSGDVNIAYQTLGSGPVDIIVVPGIISHVEFLHELPGYTAFSGHEYRTRRPNTWLLRPTPQVKIFLANPEPSTHGPSTKYRRASLRSAQRPIRTRFAHVEFFAF
ncbi:hypothetical protein [Bradyrhizobium sp. RT5a]|uniref:hypothetical protein n=1 Tax=Bradyrhizobium sp. RT5a TaxID=3156380 RepID=UPI003398CD73